MSGEPFIVTGGREEFDRKREDGVYDITATVPERYIDPEVYGGEIYQLLSDELDDENEYTVLDIGSSSGEPLDVLIDELEADTGSGFQGYALDVDRGMMERYRQEGDGAAVQAKAQELPFSKNSFDIVISANLHLLPQDIEEIVGEIDRVLATGGVAVLSEGYELPEKDYTGAHRGKIAGL